MSGTIALPDSITISEALTPLRAEILPGTEVALPPGVPVFPLAAEPGQSWDLQVVNGALVWVQFTAPPGQTAFGLEDGLGALLLEDGAGVLILEQ